LLVIVSIVVVSTYSEEGSDRTSLTFDPLSQICDLAAPGQDNLIQVISAVSTKTVVAMTAPGAVLTPWRNSVQSILWGGLPGQEYGHALADVVFGSINPSGRMTVTLPNSDNEVGFTPSEYPGIKKEGDYDEGMLIDYRWYTAHGVTPAFPFGHGLSYTTFSYSSLSASAKEVSVTVTNTGSVAGTEVAQLYLGFPTAANTPPLQLKGFAKSKLLQPTESQEMIFKLKDFLLSVWDPSESAFVVTKGTYKVFVGASSSDIRTTTEFVV